MYGSLSDMADEGGDLDSWEHQADSGMLDKRLEEMTLEIKQSEESKRQQQATRPQVIAEDSSRTQYQPQVRILRRDAQSSSGSDSSKKKTQGAGSQGASKHSKSLQQREAEYAEARLRIFGTLPPNDDEEDVGGEETETSERRENGNGDCSVISKSMPQILKPDESETHVMVLRQPKGPDGTNGFNKPDHT